jgi:hypothetical protein
MGDRGFESVSLLRRVGCELGSVPIATTIPARRIREDRDRGKSVSYPSRCELERCTSLCRDGGQIGVIGSIMGG